MRTHLLAFNFACLLVYLISGNFKVTEAWLGINFGEDGNNLPSRGDVVQKLVDMGIKNARIYHTYPETMAAFADTGIDLVIGITNADYPTALSDVDSALNWLSSNVLPYKRTSVKSITVGNEVLSTGSQYLTDLLLSSMENLYSALQQTSLGDIKVTTAHAYDIMGVTYPPSAGTFNPSHVSAVSGIVDFLSRTDSFMFMNIYPYFTYELNKENVALSYALLEPGEVIDSGNGNIYTNLLAQQLDAVYAALDAMGYGNLQVRVSEIGWPSDGGDDANISNARTHNQNLVALTSTKQGTPLKPDNDVDAFLFAMFNENLKPEGTEQHWGLYYPDLTEVYHIDFLVPAMVSALSQY